MGTGRQVGAFFSCLPTERVLEDPIQRAWSMHLGTTRYPENRIWSRKSEGGKLCSAGQLVALGIGYISRIDGARMDESG